MAGASLRLLVLPRGCLRRRARGWSAVVGMAGVQKVWVNDPYRREDRAYIFDSD